MLGGHSLLVDELPKLTLLKYKKENVWGTGKPQKIDDKYLLLAGLYPKCKIHEDTKMYTYYQLCLDNDGDDDNRYGIYANGVLVETPSVNQYKESEWCEL
jgi:hypothetical protein